MGDMICFSFVTVLYFFLSWKRGERLRPTFLFLSREKKKRAAPGTKKKSAGSGFRGESCSFFVRALRPGSGCLGAMRTGFTFCAAAADRCGWAGFYVEKSCFSLENCGVVWGSGYCMAGLTELRQQRTRIMQCCLRIPVLKKIIV